MTGQNPDGTFPETPPLRDFGGIVRVTVVSDPDWLPGLEAELAPLDLTRIGPDEPLPPADVRIIRADAPWEGPSTHDPAAPRTVWVVPAGAPRAGVDALRAAGEVRVLVEPVDAPAVAAAVQDLAGEAGLPAADEEDPGKAPVAAAAARSLSAIWDAVRATTMNRLEVLESVGAALLAEGEEPAWEEGVAAAHKLHGSLGTFGLARGSELAAELESLLADRPLESAEVFRFSECLVELRDVIESGRGLEEPVEPGGGGPALGQVVGNTALIVEPDGRRAEKLAAAAVARGWRPEVVEDAVAALGFLEGEPAPPLVAVVDPAVGPDPEVERLIKGLREAADPVPVVIHTRGHAQSARLRAVELGAQSFVDKLVPPDAVMARAAAEVERDFPGEATVLAVDDDPAVLRAVTFILRGAGLRVETLADPTEFWATLEAVGPDLLLLDVEMPEVSGYQLCRAVRADPRRVDLPVLFMTARGDPRAVIAGYEAGGDDYIVKPVVGSELITRVEARLDRLADRTRAAGSDAATGLPTRLAGRERLAAQLGLASRYREVVGLALIRFLDAEGAPDPERLVRAAPGVRKVARPGDVVARWGRAELLVARYGADPDPFSWLARLPDEGRWAVRVGAARFPDDASVDALVGRAQRGLAAAEVAEFSPGEIEAAGGVEAPEIVIVEDDEALADLLRHTLDDRGYRTRWVRDGARAADLLTGDARLRPALVILDVGLPGLDGLSLLRRLGREGVLRSTRVLMLTARSAESEVVQSLELGAFDHVPKPFSVSELVHRVRRALGDQAAGP